MHIATICRYLSSWEKYLASIRNVPLLLMIAVVRSPSVVLSLAICLSTITQGGRIDCCKHTFCLECIKKWSEVGIFSSSHPQKSNHCPECRKAFHYITPCKVFKDEKALQNSYSLCSEYDF